MVDISSVEQLANSLGGEVEPRQLKQTLELLRLEDAIAVGVSDRE